ncbi:MAG TPA: TIGR03013 family XrtA/PEP-CTERM system glycosyltransferase [Candidatus Sulfotelmatobacter sp.]
MIRLFKVYYPVRALVLLAGEALIIWLSFLLGTLLQHGDDSYVLLNYEGGYFKIFLVTGIVLLVSHWLDLYDSSRLGVRWEQVFRLLMVLGLVAIVLAGLGFIFPHLLPGNGSALVGLLILTFLLFGWRSAYGWLVRQPFLRERVYVLGTGERALRLVNGLRRHAEMGVEVVGWTGNVEGALTRESAASHLLESAKEKGVHRVIVAMPDRRGTLPVGELLDLRLGGIKVEEATSWLEKISGRIEVEQLYPSWLIFADGFRFSGFVILRRVFSTIVAFVGLVLSLPLLPLIMLATKLDSNGPIFYRQKRVGIGGTRFHCYKFRTMREDAEADTGATWATDDDPRITRVGRLLRSSRLDEIPQLWCVLKGDMAFVGPRPERPEFVEWLSKEIPYYSVRHVVRPGITGWAQVQYKYGNTLEDAREKLQYDLFYIKNASIGLDLLIMFQTIKIVLLGRGAQ